MRIKSYVSFLAGAFIGFSCAMTVHAQENAEELLNAGSPAPKLDIEHWIHLANGKFEPVTDFEPGHVYVVEFWATWCGPCIQSMPHLVELQNQYADRGMQIISVSDEDLATVDAFLERNVPGSADESSGDEQVADGGAEDGEPAEATTYRQLTSAYCLTTDPDQSTHEDYMRAAQINSIPHCFLVGKDARIEWFGHPMQLEEPLKAVLNDRWDREAFAETIRSQRETQKLMQEIVAMLQGQDFEGALELLDQAIAKDDENVKLSMLKLQVLIVSEQMDQANQHLQSIFEARRDHPQEINLIAWNIYEQAAQERIPAEALVTQSQIAASSAAERTDDPSVKASLLDTAAHLLALQGEFDQAIALEERAIELTTLDQDREFFQRFLNELKQTKAARDNPQASPAVDAIE